MSETISSTAGPAGCNAHCFHDRRQLTVGGQMNQEQCCNCGLIQLKLVPGHGPYHPSVAYPSGAWVRDNLTLLPVDTQWWTLRAY